MILQGLNTTHKVSDLVYRFVFAMAIAKSDTNWRIGCDDTQKSQMSEILYNATNTKGTRMTSGNTVLGNSTYISQVDKHDFARLSFDLIFSVSTACLISVCEDIGGIRYGVGTVKHKNLCNILDNASMQDLLQYYLQLVQLHSVQRTQILQCCDKLLLEYDNVEQLKPALYNCNFMHSTIFSWFRSLATQYDGLDNTNVEDLYLQLKPDIIKHMCNFSYGNNGLLGDDSSIYGLLHSNLNYFLMGYYKDMYKIHNASKVEVFEKLDKFDAGVVEDVSVNIQDLLPDMYNMDELLFAHKHGNSQDVYLSSVVEYLQHREIQKLYSSLDNIISVSHTNTSLYMLKNPYSYMLMPDCNKHRTRVPTGNGLIYDSGNNESQAKFMQRKNILDILVTVIEQGFPEDVAELDSILNHVRQTGSAAPGNKFASLFGNNFKTNNLHIDTLMKGSLAWYKFLIKLKANGVSIFDISQDVIQDRMAYKKFQTVHQLEDLSYGTYNRGIYHSTDKETLEVTKSIPNFETIITDLGHLKSNVVDISVPFVDVKHKFKAASKKDRTTVQIAVLNSLGTLMNRFNKVLSDADSKVLTKILYTDYKDNVYDVATGFDMMYGNSVQDSSLHMSCLELAMALKSGCSAVEALGMEHLVDNRCVTDSLRMSQFDQTLDYFYSDSFYVRAGEAYNISLGVDSSTYLVKVNDFAVEVMEDRSIAIGTGHYGYNGVVLQFKDHGAAQLKSNPIPYLQEILKPLDIAKGNNLDTADDYLTLLRSSVVYVALCNFMFEVYNNLETLQETAGLHDYNMLQFIARNSLLFKLPNMTTLEFLVELSKKYELDMFMRAGEDIVSVYKSVLPVAETLLDKLQLDISDTQGGMTPAETLAKWKADYYAGVLDSVQSKTSGAFEVNKTLEVLNVGVKRDLHRYKSTLCTDSYQRDHNDFCLRDGQYITKTHKGVKYYLHASGVYAGLRLKACDNIDGAPCYIKLASDF